MEVQTYFAKNQQIGCHTRVGRLGSCSYLGRLHADMFVFKVNLGLISISSLPNLKIYHQAWRASHSMQGIWLLTLNFTIALSVSFEMEAQNMLIVTIKASHK